MDKARVDPATIARERSLQKLPLLQRATITQQVQRLRATNISADRFVPNGTGGSTGEPLRFFDDREKAGWSDAAAWRSHRWYGVDVGDRCAYLWGSAFDLSRFQGLNGRLRARALNLLMLPAWELSERTASKFWTQLADFKPRLLLGYAGAVYEWARLLGEHREPITGLRAIVVSAETLYDDWRKVIERCFRVPVYNRYGGRDIHFVAQECPKRQGLHINSENVLVEIVRDGQPVQPGELGEIVVTRLDNFAMPFIRYRSGDLGVMASLPVSVDALCHCLEKSKVGVQDAIVTADGRIVSGLFFAHMMKDCPDVREFQIHQLALDRLLIAIVLQGTQRFSSRERIERLVRHYMGSDTQIEFEIRDEIPFTPSGKRRITVSHLRSYEPRQTGTDGTAG